MPMPKAAIRKYSNSFLFERLFLGAGKLKVELRDDFFECNSGSLELFLLFFIDGNLHLIFQPIFAHDGRSAQHHITNAVFAF